MRSVWVSLIVGIIVLAAVFYVYTTNVTVHNVTVSIHYTAGAAGYLALNSSSNLNYGAASYTYPGFSVGGLKQHTLYFFLFSNATDLHKILSINAQAVGFTIIQVKPSSTFNVPANTQGLAISLLIQAPFLGYDGDLEITLQVA